MIKNRTFEVRKSVQKSTFIFKLAQSVAEFGVFCLQVEKLSQFCLFV